MAQTVKNLPAMQETQVQSLGQEDPLEKGMANHSRILAWRILWTEDPGKLQSRGPWVATTEWLTLSLSSIRKFPGNPFQSLSFWAGRIRSPLLIKTDNETSIVLNRRISTDPKTRRTLKACLLTSQCSANTPLTHPKQERLLKISKRAIHSSHPRWEARTQSHHTPRDQPPCSWLRV